MLRQVSQTLIEQKWEAIVNERTYSTYLLNLIFLSLLYLTSCCGIRVGLGGNKGKSYMIIEVRYDIYSGMHTPSCVAAVRRIS